MLNLLNISKQSLLLLLLAMGFFGGCVQEKTLVPKAVDPFEGVSRQYVDSLLETLSLQEKIGQLLIWENDQAPDSAALTDMLLQAEKGRVGGMLVQGLDVADFLAFRQHADALATLPLFWGTRQSVSLHQDFKGFSAIPRPISLAALDSVGLAKEVEDLFFSQCSGLGLNLAIGPRLNDWNKTVDPNAFFALPGNFEQQTRSVLSFIERSRQQRMLSFGQNLDRFILEPNDTIRDSLNYRWKLAGNAGISGLVLTDKIFQYDTLARSKPGFLQKYLSTELSMKGLAVARLGKVESPFYKLLVGADVLLTDDPKRAFYAIVKLVERGSLTEPYLDKKVRKVLMAKAWMEGGQIKNTQDRVLSMGEGLARLTSYEPPSSSLRSEEEIERSRVLAEEWKCYFEDPAWELWAKNIFEASVTLVKDERQLVPLQWQRGTPLNVWVVSGERMSTFLGKLSKYADYSSRQVQPKYGVVPVFDFPPVSEGEINIVLLDQVDLSSQKNARFLRSLNANALSRPMVVVNFGYPSNLSLLNKDISLLQVYERNGTTEAACAQIIFGGLPAKGKLPLTIDTQLTAGSGIVKNSTRLGFDDPKAVGIAPERLTAINAIVESAIDDKAFPGCQVLVAKDGKVVYTEAFGNYDYRHEQATNTVSLYDVASITKVAATTLAVMKLAEKGSLKVSSSLSSVLDLEEGATVGKIKIGELLQHRSGLQAQMPIGRYFNSRSVPAKGCNKYFCRYQKEGYGIQVCDGLFFNSLYRDSILLRTHKLRVDYRKRYRYSDVNFVLLQQVVEQKTGRPLDQYVDSMFYLPLGLRYTTFNPLHRFSPRYIVPTENDRIWRKALVHGFVHDPTAALLGGVSGNAGLFTTAEDLAVIFQMLLNGGTYGGRRYFSPATIKWFTESKKSDQRALGFDKPAFKRFPTYSDQVSDRAFGHTGFTGTCVWADPEVNLVYIFLSNRVHPSARNSKMKAGSIRARVHDAIYDALNTYQVKLPTLPASVKKD
ncbi:MAG: glycoside hydrolase family 3 N-terminal domain-containing protein [Saprospiraceae bacterium]